MPQHYKKRPHPLPSNFTIHLNIQSSVTSEHLTMLTILTHFLPSETKKEKLQKKTSDIHSTTTNTTTSISNEDSTNVTNFSHDDFLKILDNNNKFFKKELESSFKNEVAEQLRQNNPAITENFNQRFPSFQTVMLQTIKDAVLQMISNIPQQQQQMQSPSF